MRAFGGDGHSFDRPWYPPNALGQDTWMWLSGSPPAIDWAAAQRPYDAAAISARFRQWALPRRAKSDLLRRVASQRPKLSDPLRCQLEPRV
jgi:hypothetical protein